MSNQKPDTKQSASAALPPERQAQLEAHVAGTPSRDRAALLETMRRNKAPAEEIALVEKLVARPLPQRPRKSAVGSKQ